MTRPPLTELHGLTGLRGPISDMAPIAPSLVVEALIDHLAHRAPLDETLAARIVESLKQRQAGEVQSLDHALGLVAARGQRRLATTETLAERDRLLRLARSRFFPFSSDNAAAKSLHRALTRYAATGWIAERTMAEPPAWRAGSIEELLHAIFRARDFVPAERTIRAILATS